MVFLLQSVCYTWDSPPRDDGPEVTYRIFVQRETMETFISARQSKPYDQYWTHNVTELEEGCPFRVGDKPKKVHSVGVLGKETCETCGKLDCMDHWE